MHYSGYNLCMCHMGNQIKHEKWSQYFHYSSPPGSLRFSLPLGMWDPPLGSGDTSEVKQSPSFKQMRCCLFLKGLERRKFHKLPRLHIPVSIKPHCLKIFPFLLSKSLMQPLKPLASCLVPKGAQHCPSHIALPAPGSPETLHARPSECPSLFVLRPSLFAATSLVGSFQILFFHFVFISNIL